jgi:glycosyltransferase involved in cell wall biosynthesis
MTARVVLLSTNLAPGGAEAQVALLAAGLRRRDWDASVISCLRPCAFEEDLKRAGVPVFSLNMQPGRWNPLGCLRLARLLRRLRPQIVHGHMFHANLLARAARLALPVPVVISTLHSIAESGRDSGNVRGRDRLYRVTDRLADVTVSVCQAAGERHAEAQAVSRSRLRVIPNGVDTDRFRPDPAGREPMRRVLGVGDEFAWLAVGRLMWKKGYETMLRAFAGSARGVLLIAGAGPQEAELREFALELGANARFLGFREDIPALLRACDGFVQSSVVEGLPVALLEAAASGLPCVAADTGGVGEIVLHETTGYLAPAGDPALLAAAMSQVMGMDAVERAELGRAAREHVAARFGLESVIDRWERLYLEMLERWM